MVLKKQWKKKGYRGRFKGSYERDRAGERIFVLNGEKKGKVIKWRIVFESWQAAKGLGWSLK